MVTSQSHLASRQRSGRREKLESIPSAVQEAVYTLSDPVAVVLGNMSALDRYLSKLRIYLAALHAGAAATDLDRLRNELRIDRILDDLACLVAGTADGAERMRRAVGDLRRQCDGAGTRTRMENQARASTVAISRDGARCRE